MIGQQFHNWTVLAKANPISNGKVTQSAILCRCNCGTEKIVSVSNVKRGRSKSCGCLRGVNLKGADHSGANNASYRHGMAGTPTYTSWYAMRSRCNSVTDERYPDYGGRGIKVSDRWNSFSNFLEDMGLRPEGTTLDRIDVDGNYEPGNCRWATPLEQAQNKRNKQEK